MFRRLIHLVENYGNRNSSPSSETEAFTKALIENADMAPEPALQLLSEAATNILNPNLLAIGKAEQRRLGPKAIPYKTELECAAGLWVVIRDALRERKEG